MDDKTMLEWAARAAGYKHSMSWTDHFIENEYGTDEAWNPLTDDGDALRLAVKLRLGFRFSLCGDFVVSGCPLDGPEEQVTGDPCAATRRAITRAAAEIGKAMGRG